MIRYIVLLMVFAPTSEAWAATYYRCTYTSFSNIKGNHAQKTEITFKVSNGNHRAEMAFRRGDIVPVHFLMGKNHVAFVEERPRNDLSMTVILDSGESVHSRSVVIDGNMVASQWYGKCDTYRE